MKGTGISMKKTVFNIPEAFVSRHYPFQDTLPPYRSQFMRDRDRIMYCTAFRRLAGKTQIYTIGNDDHKKNRLTHSLEVAQISKTIAHALKLDENLAEAIALGHDLGHTPFGHAGEEMLHEIMIPMSKYIKASPLYNGRPEAIKQELSLQRLPSTCKNFVLENTFGFKHNIQSVRMVSLLEDNYRDNFGNNIGLNLTNYTLWGMINHSSQSYKPGMFSCDPTYQTMFSNMLNVKGNNNVEAWSFEAYIVRIADDIAQWHHDLEDALRGNAISIKRLCETIENALGGLSQNDKDALNEIKQSNQMDRNKIAIISHIVVNSLISDLVETSHLNFQTLKNELNNKVKKDKEKRSEILFSEYKSLGFSMNNNEVIAFSKKINCDEFRKTIKNLVHHSRDVERMNGKGQYIIRKIFEAYISNPQQLPDGPIMHFMVDIGEYKNIDLARETGAGIVRTNFDQILRSPLLIYKLLLMRRICDYIASMTDRYAIEDYNHLYG